MKIIVDSMPEKRYDCPYYKDESTIDYSKSHCKYSNKTCSCSDSDNPNYNCDYFIGLEKAMFDIRQSYIEY